MIIMYSTKLTHRKERRADFRFSIEDRKQEMANFRIGSVFIFMIQRRKINQREE